MPELRLNMKSIWFYIMVYSLMAYVTYGMYSANMENNENTIADWSPYPRLLYINIGFGLRLSKLIFTILYRSNFKSGLIRK